MRELAELHLVRWNVLYDEASTGRQLPLIAPDRLFPVVKTLQEVDHRKTLIVLLGSVNGH